MIMDKELLFSEGQAVTATAYASNLLDLGPGKVGASRIRLFVGVAPGVTGSGTITAKLFTSQKEGSTNGLDDPEPVCDFPLVAAALNKGGKLVDACLPAKIDRFLALQYVIDGTVTGAKLTAGLVLDTDMAGH